MSKDSAGQGSIVFAVVDDGLAVDEQETNSGGVLVGLIESGTVAELFGIEHDNIRKETLLQVTPIFQAQNIGGQAAGAPDGCLQREKLLFNRKSADLSWEAAVASGMRNRIARDLRAAIAGRGHEWLLHDEPDVFFIHAKGDDLSAPVLENFYNYFEHRFLLFLGNRHKILALPGAISGVTSNSNRLPRV